MDVDNPGGSDGGLRPGMLQAEGDVAEVDGWGALLGAQTGAAEDGGWGEALADFLGEAQPLEAGQRDEEVEDGCAGPGSQHDDLALVGIPGDSLLASNIVGRPGQLSRRGCF